MQNMSNPLHQQYLDTMGIIIWQLKAVNENKPGKNEIENSEDAWLELAHCVQNCTRCGLDRTRTNTVFGSGSQAADLLIVGEAPGANEDQQGAPFVGRAGMLLTEMLNAIGVKRESIYITNILKCRPPNNRDPLPYEVECCTPHLKKQIELLKPKLMVAVGRIAAHFLLNTTTSLSKLRGHTYQYNDIPLLITYHPAYLLRSPLEKAKAFEDLLMIQKALNLKTVVE